MHATTLLVIALVAILTPTIHAGPIISIFSWLGASKTPELPSSSLPRPTTTLKFIALGLGTQNYTCASPSATPVAAGALAKLYDATYIMSRPGLVGTVSQHRMPCFADRRNNAFGLQRIGTHFFDAAGVPNFSLPGVGPAGMELGRGAIAAGDGDYLTAQKTADVSAPADACTGRTGSKAVDWLYLTKAPKGPSRGVGRVYRVETAGGTATSCAGVKGGWVTVDYSAEYWFYE